MDSLVSSCNTSVKHECWRYCYYGLEIFQLCESLGCYFRRMKVKVWYSYWLQLLSVFHTYVTHEKRLLIWADNGCKLTFLSNFAPTHVLPRSLPLWIDWSHIRLISEFSINIMDGYLSFEHLWRHRGTDFWTM